MDKILIVGDSYSYGFKKYINNPQVKVLTFFAEYIMNIDNKSNHIRQTFVDEKNKKNNLVILKETLKSFKPTIIIFNFGQVDINFSYFYNRVFGVPYNIECIINQYMNIIKKYSSKCKKVYVINFLPLFADTWEDLSKEFQIIHVNDLFKKLTKQKIKEIFDIGAYRKHLHMSNKLLCNNIKKRKWKIPVSFLNFNRCVYDGNYMKYKDEYYIQKKKRHDKIHITLDFHINGEAYVKNILKRCRIPELKKILSVPNN